MIKKMVPALIALVAFLGIGAPATANAATSALPTKCANVGFSASLICIDVNKNNWVTVWYDKRSNLRDTCRLSFSGPDGGHEDEGWFTIEFGQLKGYRWYPPVYTGAGAYTGFLRCGGGGSSSGTLFVG